jgi:shikimate kinase
MQKHIFLIGPGATGKTTFGKLLAQKLKIKFVDIDAELASIVGSIKEYCEKYGYEKYHMTNSYLFYKLLLENRKNKCIFTISPGMLMRGMEKIKNKNINKVNKNGISVLLMPSRSIRDSINIIFKREKRRNWHKDKDALLKKIKSDVRNYSNLGDIKIYTNYDTKKNNIEKIIKKLSR